MRGWFPEVVQPYWRIAEYRTNSVVTWRGKPWMISWGWAPSFILPKETGPPQMMQWTMNPTEAMGWGDSPPSWNHTNVRGGFLYSKLKEGSVVDSAVIFGVVTQNMAKRKMGVFETVFAFWPGQKWTDLYLQQMHNHTKLYIEFKWYNCTVSEGSLLVLAAARHFFRTQVTTGGMPSPRRRMWGFPTQTPRARAASEGLGLKG